MSQILENLWIANIHNVRDEYFISYITKATHILNCTEELPLLYPKPLITKRIPLNDDGEEDTCSVVQITEAIDILDDWLQNKENRVIVHCAAGISRSPTVVLGWLIKKKGMSFDDAMDFVHSKRDFIRPNPFFLRFLKVL
jgi:atypical dual specificity phosphatase